MKVTWLDLGKPDRPSTYVYQDCEVFVDQNAVQVWREHPDAVFTLIIAHPFGSAEKASLGAYEVPDGNAG
jgi:hypothetical protein